VKFHQANVIHVRYRLGGATIPVGRIALQNRKIFFEYASDFLGRGLELSPFKLPLKPGVMVCEERVFDGLFGVFNDSLPDGWGRLLLDRKLQKMGLNPDNMTPLDRLQYVGSHGMGALVYEPEIYGEDFKQFHEDLDVIANECLQFQEQDEDQYVDELLVMNGSSAGARPKILVNLTSNNKKFEVEANPHIAQSNWIIKFRSSIDPKDVGSIEYAYHLMAVDAGLDVPEARLFPSKKGGGYFGVKLFDRNESTFLHMHTFSGLLHIDHRVPCVDYEALMKATFWLTKDIRECEKQFRNVVFNVLAHNRDDHAKNFSFLMDQKGIWKVSPAYDLIFSSGPGGEHHTTIMGEGKNPQGSHLLKLAAVASLKPATALEIIDQVKGSVSKWSQFASEAFVGYKSCSHIQKELDLVLGHLV